MKLQFQLFQQNFSVYLCVSVKSWNKATGFRLSQFTKCGTDGEPYGDVKDKSYICLRNFQA